MVNIDN